MIERSKWVFAVAAAAMLGHVIPASAQQTPPTPPSPPPAGQQQLMISAEQALEIARREGVVSVDELDRENGRWDVEGKDNQGREIEVKINATTGQVIKVERD